MIMMAAIHALTSLIDSVATVSVATWLFRITIITVLACMYLALARRAQPALRHAVAVASLVAVALLPLASRLMPNLNVPVLRAPGAASSVKDPSPLSFDVSPGRAPGKYKISDVHFTPVAGTTAKPAVTTARGLMQRAFSFARAALVSGRNWIRFALVMWILAGAALLLRLALAIASVSRIARRATPIHDEFLRVEIERACRALGVTRWIDIAASGEITVPMVIGIGTPRIVLPLAAEEWSRERMS